MSRWPTHLDEKSAEFVSSNHLIMQGWAARERLKLGRLVGGACDGPLPETFMHREPTEGGGRKAFWQQGERNELEAVCCLQRAGSGSLPKLTTM